jgi:phosphoribosyl 1,2-cyclic phosphodiesterase
VEVRSEKGVKKTSIILDAGTGIIKCSENALLRGDRVFHVFLTHMHYDHIIGFTKFLPFFKSDCKIHIYGQAKCGQSLQEIFQQFFSAPFFPIDFFALPSLKSTFFHEINDMKPIFIDGVKIEFQELNHPQQALAYKVRSIDGNTNIVYAIDHEHGTAKDGELKDFIRFTNLFIYDATYSENNYMHHIGWGHSTAERGALLAREAQVKRYVIFHHDPTSDDDYLENVILPQTKRIFHKSLLAQEGRKIKL